MYRKYMEKMNENTHVSFLEQMESATRTFANTDHTVDSNFKKANVIDIPIVFCKLSKK